MKSPRPALAALIASVALIATSASAGAQTLYTWNNTGTDWSASGSWSPSDGPPATESHYAQFNTLGTFGTTAVNDPTWASSPAQYGRLTLGPTAQLTGWTFASSGSLQQFNIQAYGPVTHTFSGPALVGNANGMSLGVGHGTTLALAGTGTALSVTRGDLYGGTLRLDNSTTNSPDRFHVVPNPPFFSNTLNSHGGTIDFVGHADGSTETLAVRIAAGTSRINVDHRSTTAPTVLTISGLGRELYSAVNFTSTGSGTLGAAGNNPRIMLPGESNGFLRPWATVNGSEYAFYNSTNGVRAAVSGTGGDYHQTYTTAVGTNLAAGQYGAIDQAAGTPNLVWSGAAGAGTGSYLRIRPGADGQSLTFALSAGNNINLGSIALAGSRDYTITRDTSNGNTGMSLTGTGGPDHRSVNVLDRNATLTLNIPIAFANSGDFVKYGDGILDLTGDNSVAGSIGGTASQTNMYVNGGVLRVSVGASGSLTDGSGQSVFLRGGVLEIVGGHLNGAAADFTHALGAGARNVNWRTTNEGRGSGGFSAYGSDATVNIGGAGNTLTWQSTIGFLSDGDALTFGSVKSNATLIFENPVGLGGATLDAYSLREIQVTRGAGNLADFTRMTGEIVGQPNTDLVKTGNGVLELAAVNRPDGNVLVQGGALVVTGMLGHPDISGRPGNIVVGRGAVLAGTGTLNPAAGKEVFVNAGGAIRGGTPVTAVAADHVGTLTVNTHLNIHSTATERGTIQFEAHKTGTTTATASKIVVGNNRNLNLEPGAGNRFAIELVWTGATTALDAGQQYTMRLASVGSGGNIRLNGTNLTAGIIDRSNYVLQSAAYSFESNYSLAVLSDAGGQHLDLTFTVSPVPEPSAVLALASVALGLVALVRRRSLARADTTPPIAPGGSTHAA